MAPRIYTSPVPSVPLVSTSVFTHLFASPSGDPNTIGGYPGSAKAFIDAETGTTLTRAQTKNLALSLGYGLRNHPNTGARRGDVVLVYSPNSLSWPILLFGAVAAGLRCTLANSAYNVKELTFQYTDSGARLVLTSEEGLPTVLEVFKQLGVSKAEAEKRIIVLGAGLQWAGGLAAPDKPETAGFLHLHDLLTLGALEQEEKFEGKDADETVYICYSSGTTGKPKGVETTHRNITSVLQIVKTTFPELNMGVDSVLGILPFYHIYGAVKLVHFPWTRGAPVVIQARFDPEKFCASIERYKITMALIVPPVLVVLARHPAVDKYDVSSLASLFSGAAPLGAALVKQVTERLERRRKGKGSVAILQGYGLTETSPTSHLLPVGDAMRKVGSIGILLPNLEARLLVDGDGNGDIEAKEGEAGELWLRGPTIMKGYLNNPTATKESITPDGWFKTGDIAIRDSEGFYYIVDRRKELIKYKGFQVPPAELESLLLTHPDIADAAVIGVESAKEATELPRAYVVHANPEKVKTEAAKITFQQSVRKWTQEQVARHKYLRGGVVVIDSIPKSPAGKILRRELRERAKTELAGRDPGDDEFKAKL
ncbi:4-coumarate--CoA ligase-like 7 [Hypsizygus marmoreus]|uniref:4-coumarate--CoA ligase-like 7 n=1 Tax=Hypsizygus marmoreus TaxID=39966 RepID=A0A369JVQ6_HYPMA|nr:4-coumarate--CoA ligase-like 7 [Hypsizygus marmoreus]